MSDYKRQCPNWIDTFLDWTMPRSEASKNFILWTAVWTLAAVLRRRVFVGKKYLGGWTCYPYLYIMFVAPPGFRKTSTVAFAMELLEQVPGLNPPPTLITQAALVKELVDAKDHAVYLTMEEFGDLIIKGGHEMYEFLTSMYDGKANLRQSTMARGLEVAEKPTVNMLSGTTPEWISGNIPKALIGGGFASRVIWVYEDKLRRRRFIYSVEKSEQELKDINKLSSPLAGDLVHIANKCVGEFELTEECAVKADKWYEDLEKDYKGFKFSGYLNRKHTLTLKVAMILHIAYDDELVITWEDFQNAIRLVESIEPNLDKVFSGVGQNKYSLDMQDIVRFVSDNGEVEDGALRRHFEPRAEPAKLQELIEGILIAGYIKRVMKTEKDDDGNVVRQYITYAPR